MCVYPVTMVMSSAGEVGLNFLLCCHDQGFFFEGVLSAAFSDSDRFVFTGSLDRTIKVWDVASGECSGVVNVVYQAKHWIRTT